MACGISGIGGWTNNVCLHVHWKVVFIEYVRMWEQEFILCTPKLCANIFRL